MARFLRPVVNAFETWRDEEAASPVLPDVRIPARDGPAVGVDPGRGVVRAVLRHAPEFANRLPVL
jgi:hypothetical protein